MVVQDDEILSAIDRVIKDVDGKYDECLVEQFVESFNIHSRLDSDRSSLILDRLKFYFEHKSFLMLNQTRAFKIFKSVSKTMRNKQELEKLMPFLDSFWKSIDTVILNNNTSAMAIMFDIFTTIVSVDELGIVWVLGREITPPIQMSIPIDGIPSLVKYYMTTMKNYHTRNRAEKLVLKLIVSKSHHPLMAKFEKLVRELILHGCSFASILDAIDRDLLDSQLHSRYKISETIKHSFLANVEKPTVDLLKICKHLSRTDLSRKFIIEKLRSKKRLDCIIYYIIGSVFEDNHFSDQLLLSYVLYPISAKSNDEETQALVNSLMATRDEKDFVEWNMNSKTQTLCLAQLGVAYKDLVYNSSRSPFTNRTFNMIIATLSNYIRCHYSLECTGSQVKNMLECCQIFELMINMTPADVRTSYKILKIMQNLLDDIQYNDHTKPLVLQFISTMLDTGRTIFMEEYSEVAGEVNDIWLKAVDIAFKFRDPELLNLFTEFFMEMCPYQQLGREKNYMKLVFEHIYSETKETDHREVLGFLMRMLIRLDLSAGDVALKKQNIKRYFDIPIMISDIICQKSMVPTTIEKLFAPSPAHGQTDNTMSDFYLCDIDSSEVREKLARAFILIVKSDSNEFTRMKSLERLKRLILLFIRDDNQPDNVLEKLITTGILKTLYEVMTGGLYSPNTFNKANEAVNSIKRLVIPGVSNLGVIILDQDLLSFYTASKASVEERFSQNLKLRSDQVNPLSCVRDILSESCERGISECY